MHQQYCRYSQYLMKNVYNINVLICFVSIYYVVSLNNKASIAILSLADLNLNELDYYSFLIRLNRFGGKLILLIIHRQEYLIYIKHEI